PGPCGARIAAQVDLVSLRLARIAARIVVVSSRPARNAANACEDCGSSRLGVSEACEDGIDGISGIDGSRLGYMTYTSIGKNYVWLDPLVRVRRQPRDYRWKFLGNAQFSGETLPNFRQKSSLKFFGFGSEGQFGHLCPAPARYRTRTGFGSDSKVEFESGPV
ncbi:unnamed protein product, partial [Prunus brigantina]